MKNNSPTIIRDGEVELSVVLETVTPLKAQEYLKTNTDNYRSIRSATVNKYARDLTSDEWSLTHQGIAFDKFGTLRDGQHRLLACIKSGKPFKTLVFRGLESDVFLDNGKSRTNSDILFYHNVKNAKQAQGAINGVRELASPKTPSLTQSESLRYATDFKEGLDYVLPLIKGIFDRKIITAPLLLAYSPASRKTLGNFIDAMQDDTKAIDPRSPALAARRYIVDQTFLKDLHNWRLCGLKVLNAFDAFSKGKPMANLTKASEEVYKNWIEAGILSLGSQQSRKVPND